MTKRLKKVSDNHKDPDPNPKNQKSNLKPIIITLYNQNHQNLKIGNQEKEANHFQRKTLKLSVLDMSHKEFIPYSLRDRYHKREH